ncbi:MAG: sugar phosphate isomerase/epimerase [Phycisphaerales bacterium]|nr:sugar phosphate isomerase/epimerase [Phycisphaerales bacterium]
MACKYGMTGGVEGTMEDRFRVLRDLGFDGVEMDSPASYSASEVRAASEATGLPVHGVVNSKHWQVRLSSPDGSVRTEAIAILDQAIRDAHAFGGTSVLLVPGVVGEEASQDEVWSRSIEGIRAVLPLAARLGIHVLIENVWNGFCYVHNGPADQTAEVLARYIDDIDSQWVGAYFDIGNHQKYGKPQEWIRTLGRRIVKLDVKGWGIQAGFTKIGDGDIDWPAIRAALDEIGYTGWATAEVGGGGRDRLQEIRNNMRDALGF